MRLNSREEEKGEAASILEGAREFGLLTAADPPPHPWAGAAWLLGPEAARSGSEKATEPCPDAWGCMVSTLSRGPDSAAFYLTAETQRGVVEKPGEEPGLPALGSRRLLLWGPEEAFHSLCFSKMGFILMTPSLPLSQVAVKSK